MERAGELGTLLRLAGPLILGYAGMQLMSLVDTAMVGRLGAAALGGVGIANGIYFTISALGIGCIAALDAPVAQALGAGDPVRARRLLWQAVRVALGASLVLLVLLALAPLLLPLAGVDAETTREARRYMYSRLLNIVPLLVFNAQRSYLQARGVTRPIVAATVLGNCGNFVGNSLLIYGDEALTTIGLPGIGLPAMGVVGAGLSSTLASFLMMALLGYAIAHLPAPEDAARRAYSPPLVRTLLRLGVPLGLQLLVEVGVFATVGVLAGRLGPKAAAAHQVAITLASFTFCVILGIGAACAVRVGWHIGRGQTAAARRAGLLAVVTSTVFMGISALGFLFGARGLVRFMTDDPGVIATAVPLLFVVAVFQLSDGVQATCAGALRGAGDPHAPLYANLVGHWFVALPVALWLGFGAHLGVVGLWWGLSIGLTVVALGLLIRFLRLSSRPIRPV